MPKDSHRSRLLQKIAVVILLVLLLVNIVLIFSSTASWRQDSGTPAASGRETVTVTYALSTLAQNSSLERFIESQENETVSWEPIHIAPDEYNDTLNRLMLAGQGPDLFELSQVWLDSYRYKDWLAPLGDMLSNSARQLLREQEAVADPDWYAAPTHVQTVWLLTNDTLLAACGFDHPPETLDEMAAAAAEISRKQAGYGKYGFLFPFQKCRDEAFSLLEQVNAAAGVFPYAWEGHQYRLETIRPLLDHMAGMKQSGGLSIDYPLSTFQSCLAQFVEGNIGMLFATPQEIASIRQAAPDFSWTVSLPPAGGSDRGCAEVLSGYLAVNNAAPKQAVELLSQFFTEELWESISAEDGFVGLAEDSTAAYAAFYSGGSRPVRYLPENNRYSYERFALYQDIFENGTDYDALETLSVSLSQNDTIRRRD